MQNDNVKQRTAYKMTMLNRGQRKNNNVKYRTAYKMIMLNRGQYAKWQC